MLPLVSHLLPLFFFFTHPPPTDLYTLSLHDALPISTTSSPNRPSPNTRPHRSAMSRTSRCGAGGCSDRKSTRLNSSHRCISYAVFCLKKKKKKKKKNNNEKYNNSK